MLAGKLDFLLRLTDTSNSALGRELGFDPSYISRMRSGKRGLPRDRFFLEPAAAYFARELQANPLRKNAAAEAVCPGRSWPETENEAEKLLLGWLNQEEQQDMERVERLLSGLAAARLLWPEAKLPPAAEKPASAGFYYGTEGKREAVLRLLDDCCVSGDPTELLVYSDQGKDWLFADAAFTRRWSEAVLRFIGRGGRLRIIHSISRSRGEMLDGLGKWMPLYLTGAVEAWYYPKPSDGAFRRTLIIARDRGAFTSNSVGDGEGLNLLVSDPAAVGALTKEFQDYLSLCVPLMRVFRPENHADMLKLLRDFEEAPNSRIVAQRLPLGCSLPRSIAVAFGKRCEPELEKFLLEAARQMNAQLDAGLTLTELLSLPPVKEVRAGHVRQPLSEFLGYDLRYSPEELKAHLRRVVSLLRSRDNYRVVLTDRVPAGTMVYAKENYGCIIVRRGAPTTAFYITEERLTDAFWTYLQHSADLGQSQDLVIRRIEEYIAEL